MLRGRRQFLILVLDSPSVRSGNRAVFDRTVGVGRTERRPKRKDAVDAGRKVHGEVERDDAPI